jgi:V/A-type H+/Na+-transporting ATPase subunit E
MEEIVGSDAIQGEIVDDARKKAARLLEEAAEESARTVAAIEEKAASVVEEIMRASEERSERFRMETMARFPLERTRMRTVFVELRLREAASSFFSSLDQARVAELAESMLARGAPFLEGQAVLVSRKGLSEAEARAVAGRALAKASAWTMSEDEGLPAAGLVARSADGSVVVRATMDLVQERLLDDRRGELARALCADAMDMEALRAGDTGAGAQGL